MSTSTSSRSKRHGDEPSCVQFFMILECWGDRHFGPVPHDISVPSFPHSLPDATLISIHKYLSTPFLFQLTSSSTLANFKGGEQLLTGVLPSMIHWLPPRACSSADAQEETLKLRNPWETGTDITAPKSSATAKSHGSKCVSHLHAANHAPRCKGHHTPRHPKIGGGSQHVKHVMKCPEAIFTITSPAPPPPFSYSVLILDPGTPE
ncbi:hypothetical protein B0T13DRAFT_90131 [Neurospora crassa]|nr:hypothetical protein B0T13DRAFT_90131 [Neurospora crassa]